MKIDVIRTYFTREFTKGIIFVDDEFLGYTLEPQMKMPSEYVYENRCIQTGSYDAMYEYSAKFKKWLIELKRIEGRSEIKIHSGNYREHTRGCILVGLRSGKCCVENSRAALVRLNNAACYAKKNHDEIKVKISCYLGSDERVTEEFLRESRK